MFRVVKDPDFNLWYIHKKFLFWWVKWYHNPFRFAGRDYQVNNSNCVNDILKVPIVIKNGKYSFRPGEYGNYFYTMDKKKPVIVYVKDDKEFKEKYAEEFI